MIKELIFVVFQVCILVFQMPTFALRTRNTVAARLTAKATVGTRRRSAEASAFQAANAKTDMSEDPKETAFCQRNALQRIYLKVSVTPLPTVLSN